MEEISPVKKIMERVVAHLRLLRPLNLTIGAFAVVIGAAIAGELHRTFTVIIALLVVVCYNAAANAVNDYCDYAIDAVNRPDRPLSRGLVARPTALWLGVALFVIGTALTLYLNWGARLLAVGAALPIMVFYTPVLKGQPLLGNIAVALVLGLAFLFTGAAVGNPAPLLVPAALAFGLTLVRELVKDIADMDGDRQAGLKTLPLTAGLPVAGAVVIGLAALVALGALVPAVLKYYGIWYLILVLVGVDAPLGYLIYSFIARPGSDSARLNARLLKFATIMGVFAIYLG